MSALKVGIAACSLAATCFFTVPALAGVYHRHLPGWPPPTPVRSPPARSNPGRSSRAEEIRESWLGKFGQVDRWSFCLTAARMAREQERR